MTDKVLLISGSPRRGNTEFILRRISEATKDAGELILLREKDIKHCFGCLACDETNQCVIQDEMQGIYEKMAAAEMFIIGTPNYFDNVSGLLKDFIDRTNPFYKTDKLLGKKLVNIITGGGEADNSKKVAEQALQSFANCHHLDVVGSYCFQALKPDEVENNPGALKTIENIIQKVEKLIEG